ncbi:hypothetical protein M407DRAFT_244670 [Tulasnella calospora MUT 4182]|uniref:Uncharacterized protein n=1 Tax=Tulasnella calospora MUT 4182 TaxID=1051891 RepID=A0A0C3KQU8_9AGAM|nr:hypothetical protein M407DRAFT_244670 [Tulasnella calospora MUT 4182]
MNVEALGNMHLLLRYCNIVKPYRLLPVPRLPSPSSSELLDLMTAELACTSDCWNSGIWKSQFFVLRRY